VRAGEKGFAGFDSLRLMYAARGRFSHKVALLPVWGKRQRHCAAGTGDYSDIGINKSGQLRLAHGAHLGRLDFAVFE
jgi:hypothetical protein